MSRIAIVTGSLGLIGAERVRFLTGQGLQVLGIDNNLRPTFFGKNASNTPNRLRLESELPTYQHHPHDIRNLEALKNLFAKHNTDINLILHTAAQPSHDWSAQDPMKDCIKRRVHKVGIPSLSHRT